MLGFDASNFTDRFDTSFLAKLAPQGYGLGITQAVSPPAPLPPTRTRDQTQVFLDANWLVDIYVWLWFDLDVSDIRNKLGLLSGFEGRIRRLWLDVEDTAAIKYNQATTEAKIQAALEECDKFPISSGRGCGIYTGRWFWTDKRYLANSTVFSSQGRDLWDSNFDGDPDALANFTPYGGWTAPHLKQYRGTTTLEGVGNVDLDVVTDEEIGAAATPPQPPARETPDDYPFPDWRQSAIAYRGALDQAGQQLDAAKNDVATTAGQATNYRSLLDQINKLSAVAVA